jgi:SP family galactose:H+ symporter-like MFS transporter
MDLYCVSQTAIGFIGSSFIGGCWVGSFILPRAADIIGRKPMFLTGLVIFVAVVVSSLFTTSINVAYFLLFMGGISETGRYYVAYVYLIEFVPAKYQNDAGLYIFMVFGFVMTYIALQFWFIFKYWQINALIAITLATLSFFLTVTWLPESPRYYFARKRFNEAAAVMKRIAKMNLGKEYEFVFKDDPTYEAID